LSLCSDQLERLLAEAGLESSRLVKLDLRGNSLHSLPATLFPPLVRRLQELRLYETHLSRQQLTAIFTSLRAGGCLRVLDLGYNDLTGVGVEEVGEGGSLVEELLLASASLTPGHLQALLARSKVHPRASANFRWTQYTDFQQQQLYKNANSKLTGLSLF